MEQVRQMQEKDVRWHQTGEMSQKLGYGPNVNLSRGLDLHPIESAALFYQSLRELILLLTATAATGG
jgi:hypothetical protein